MCKEVCEDGCVGVWYACGGGEVGGVPIYIGFAQRSNEDEHGILQFPLYF